MHHIILRICEGMKGKVVIVTGGSSGIGKALVYAFADAGFRVVFASRSFEKMQQIEQEILAKGLSVLPVLADVSKEDDCKNLINTCTDTYGGIDILVNNAGISMRAAFIDVDLQVMHELMNTNFWGTVHCTKYALPHLLKSKGSVVGISSIAGFQGLPGRTGYSASKYAIHGFLETLRIEHIKDHLHVMLVCPGFTASNIRKSALCKDGSPQGQSPQNESKLMPPEQVASIILKGIKKRNRTLVITSKGKLIVFLRKFFPVFIDKMILKAFTSETDSPIK